MRCSSCEPLLDRYIEGTLKARQMLDIREHLEECAACRALLEELKVVDALLATTEVPDLPANFTFAVMAETNAMPAPRARQHPIWSFLALYLAAAWVAAVLGLALTGTSPVTVVGALSTALTDAGMASSAFGTSLSQGLGTTVPTLAAFGFSVLLVDIAIAFAIALLYFVVRPRLAARVASVSEAP